MATAAEKAAAKAAQEQAAAEQAAAEQAAAEQAAAEQAAAEQAAADQVAATETKDTGEKFVAVCLRDCEFGKAGDLVEISEHDINVGKAHGAIDDHADAVAYAREQKGE